MDITDFLQWLQDTAADPSLKTTHRIIRFQRQDDYERFIREWPSPLTPDSESLSPLDALKPIPIIQSVSFPLPVQETLSQFEGLVSLEEDRRIAMHAAPQKSFNFDKGVPWGVQHVKAPLAWSTTTGHRVKIGVIDTGVDFSHPDLRQSLSRGINLLNRSMLPHDDNGHGTHIAGTIAAANQVQGMIGIAPRSQIYPVKAFDNNGSAFVSDIILGIDWCVRNRIQIINMSFGMKTRSKALYNAVTNAYNAGVIVVASSGNDGKRRSVDYPARYPQTISVGATTRLRRIAPFSNRGIYIDIYAPGEKIVSAWLRGKYHEMSGTSMATSHVSGAIALLLAHRPGLSPGEIKTILKRSIQPLRGTKAPKTIGELDIMRMLNTADR
ncbi:S8 family serine peptidase [Paenibacillus sp. NPDC058071]|uniref:S8 family peptidase n=1 Tax=Paenibacillus sp. NPDC058071 TaxID=3346326 RepID=UPI0036DE8699